MQIDRVDRVDRLERERSGLSLSLFLFQKVSRQKKAVVAVQPMLLFTNFWWDVLELKFHRE